MSQTKPWLVALVVFWLVIGCGVKAKTDPVGGAPQAATAGNLPPGLFVSENQKFLVRPSTLDLEPNADNTVFYKLMTAELAQVNAREYTFEVESDMPTMPQMGGPWKAPTEINAEGNLAATYTIWHGHKRHLWQFTIRILKDGKLVDKLVYSHLVRVE